MSEEKPTYKGRATAARERAITDVRSLARATTPDCIKVLKKIVNNEASTDLSRIAAAKVLLDRGWGRAPETHHIDVNEGASLLKVVNEIVHVHETREQIEFTDQTPLLELNPEDIDGNGSKKTH